MQLNLKAWVFAMAVACASAQAGDTELRASMTAEVELKTLDVAPRVAPQAGQVFRIAVTLTDAVTGKTVAPKDGLQAWIRPVSANNAPCADAARSFRATFRLPSDAIDLNGVVVASVTADGNVIFVDPKLDLATANIIAAHNLGTVPHTAIVHPDSRSLLLSMTGKGQILELRPMLKNARIFAGQLEEPGDLLALPGGKLLVAENAAGRVTMFDAKGQRQQEIKLNSSPIYLGGSGELALAFSKTEAVVLDATTGEVRQRFAPAAGVRAASLWSNGRSATLVTLEEGAAATFRFLDDAEAAVRIPLAAVATRISITPDGATAFAFDPQGRAVSIISLATGKFVQALAFDAGIADIAYARDTAFLRLADGTAVITLALKSINPGVEPSASAELGRVSLGPPDRSGLASKPGLLTPLGETGNVIAVHPDTFTGFIVSSDMRAANTLPPTALRLRGGIPASLHVIDRSFRREANNTFTTEATIGEAGAYELVLTTGVLGLTACHAFKVDGTNNRPPRISVSLVPAQSLPRLTPGVESDLAFRLWDGEKSLAMGEPVSLRVTSMATGWRKTARTRLQDGTVTARVTFPFAGNYVIEVLGLPKSMVLKGTPQVEVVQ